MCHPKEHGVEQSTLSTPQEQSCPSPAEDETAHDPRTWGPEANIAEIAKGWSLAMHYSKERFQAVYHMDETELEAADADGRLFLETTCLFVHAAVKRGQYRLPAEFWRILHFECGIIVYPSAMVEEVNIEGVGRDRAFLDAYAGHIALIAPRQSPMPDPFEYLQEPPPLYAKDCSDDETTIASSLATISLTGSETDSRIDRG